MKDVEFKQGETTAWSDGEKVVIKSPMGRAHIKDNVEQIFGMGEYDKLYDVKYFEDIADTGRNYEFVSGYIPQRVKDELGWVSQLKQKAAGLDTDPFNSIKDV